MESPSCIHFLIKLLKPVISTAAKDKAVNIGSKLLGLRKDSDIFRDTTKLVDSSSADIVAKVQEVLVSCKDIKTCCDDINGMERPELSPKWIALLTMEKACLSKISFEGIIAIIIYAIIFLLVVRCVLDPFNCTFISWCGLISFRYIWHGKEDRWEL